ncbi:hypothetical protein B0H16DRAFT_1826404 [Mycena metata]|uniref:Uncharacterized protein n=1 Tax=Mycena metata TaxID=1033252 RepID=A0AAD7M8M8_9AGAR|nr:hypothetical protein B0H16DRAFT_1826404 [Mycena metata]
MIVSRTPTAPTPAPRTSMTSADGDGRQPCGGVCRASHACVGACPPFVDGQQDRRDAAASTATPLALLCLVSSTVLRPRPSLQLTASASASTRAVSGRALVVCFPPRPPLPGHVYLHHGLPLPVDCRGDGGEGTGWGRGGDSGHAVVRWWAGCRRAGTQTAARALGDGAEGGARGRESDALPCGRVWGGGDLALLFLFRSSATLPLPGSSSASVDVRCATATAIVQSSSWRPHPSTSSLLLEGHLHGVSLSRVVLMSTLVAAAVFYAAGTAVRRRGCGHHIYLRSARRRRTNAPQTPAPPVSGLPPTLSRGAAGMGSGEVEGPRTYSLATRCLVRYRDAPRICASPPSGSRLPGETPYSPLASACAHRAVRALVLPPRTRAILVSPYHLHLPPSPSLPVKNWIAPALPWHFLRLTQMSDYTGAAVLPPGKVWCNCQRKCGGPDGRKPVAYSTRTLHRREDTDTVAASVAFSTFLQTAAAESSQPSTNQSRPEKRPALDQLSGTRKRQHDGTEIRHYNQNIHLLLDSNLLQLSASLHRLHHESIVTQDAWMTMSPTQNPRAATPTVPYLQFQPMRPNPHELR